MNATTPRPLQAPRATTSPGALGDSAPLRGEASRAGTAHAGTARAGTGWAAPMLLALAAAQASIGMAVGQPAAWAATAAALGLIAVLPLTGWLPGHWLPGNWLARGSSRRRDRAALLRPAGWLLAGGIGQLLAGGLVASAAWLLESGWGRPSAILMLVVQAALLPLLMLQAFALTEALFGRSFNRRWPALPVPLGLPLPRVSLHLPLHNADPARVRDTLDSLAALEHADFEVLVVDTSTDPAFWEPVADHCARRGPRFHFFHLGGAPGLTEAALAFALREADGRAQILGLLQPGTTLPADWLRRMLPLFERPGLGFAQALLRQHGDLPASRWQRFAAALGRPASAVAIAANERNGLLLDGGPALLRRSALLGAGGWASYSGGGDDRPADQPAELSLRLLRQGWEGACIPDAMGHVPAPPDAASWRAGVQACIASRLAVLRDHAAALLNPLDRGLTAGQRRHLLAGWAPTAVDALWLALVVLALLSSLPLLARPGLVAPVALLLPAVVAPLGFRVLRAMALAPAGGRGLAVLADLTLAPLRAMTLWRVLLGRHPQPRGQDGAGWLAALLWGTALPLALLGQPAWAALLLLLSLPCLARLAVGWAGRLPQA